MHSSRTKTRVHCVGGSADLCVPPPPAPPGMLTNWRRMSFRDRDRLVTDEDARWQCAIGREFASTRRWGARRCHVAVAALLGTADGALLAAVTAAVPRNACPPTTPLEHARAAHRSANLLTRCSHPGLVLEPESLSTINIFFNLDDAPYTFSRLSTSENVKKFFYPFTTM